MFLFYHIHPAGYFPGIPEYVDQPHDDIHKWFLRLVVIINHVFDEGKVGQVFDNMS